MQHLQQPPTARPHHPNPPGVWPVAPQHLYGPPTQPPARQQPYPMMVPHGPVRYPHHHLPPGGRAWAPTHFAPRSPRVGMGGKHLPFYLGATLTVIAAALLITGFWTPGFFVTKQLDISAAQAGVTHVLSDSNGYGARNVSDVRCNDGHNPTIVQGGTFTCQATIDRIKHQFVATFTDDAGSYEISTPKGTKV